MTETCRPCQELPAAVADWRYWYSYDKSPGPPDEGEFAAAHGALEKQAWRTPYPQEGGDILYRCRACGAWWYFTVWTCVNDLYVTRDEVASLETWVRKYQWGAIEGRPPPAPSEAAASPPGEGPYRGRRLLSGAEPTRPDWVVLALVVLGTITYALFTLLKDR